MDQDHFTTIILKILERYIGTHRSRDVLRLKVEHYLDNGWHEDLTWIDSVFVVTPT